MIDVIKNIHTEDLIFSGETLVKDTLSDTIQFWTDENLHLFSQYVTEGKIEVRTFDESVLGIEKALQFANYKSRRIKAEGNYPVLYDLVHNFFYSHPFCAIDTKYGLLSGVYLQEVLTFDVRGFATKKEFYHKYKGKNDKGTLVFKKENNFTLGNLYPWPSSNPVISREQIETFMNIDGSDNIKVQKTNKFYPDPAQYNSEGERRRSNKENQGAPNIVTAIIYSGGSGDQLSAQGMLLQLFEHYDNYFTAWRKYGQGDIYDAIDNDTDFSWLNGIVADTPETQALIPSAIGETVRNYFNDNLKGLK